MFSSFRNRFGIPGVISVIALVFAMFGGAYAASNDSGSATVSAKAKKGPRGPRGPQGPAGPQGPKGDTGAAGAAGAKGDTGAAGANGKDGTNGTNGAQGLKGATGPTGATGATGDQGDPGDPGDPWTAGGTLPSGATETGVWAVGGPTAPKGPIFTTISFPVPLAAKIPESNIKLLPLTHTGTEECPGTGGDATPKAKAGYLCVYTSTANEAALVGSLSPTFTAEETGLTGQILVASVTEAGGVVAGTFAVTAP